MFAVCVQSLVWLCANLTPNPHNLFPYHHTLETCHPLMNARLDSPLNSAISNSSLRTSKPTPTPKSSVSASPTSLYAHSMASSTFIMIFSSTTFLATTASEDWAVVLDVCDHASAMIPRRLRLSHQAR
ncbi:hypothetical protein K438DRAFT_1825919 [Mycena galopus ATCC 62051]|nr:hypothetical protein K438DRAFT_1825919 [Mycena galopus ATCC 62051]